MQRSSLSSKAILVVEDDDLQRQALQQLLELEGFDVWSVGDVPSAQRELQSRPVQAVITDVHLPGDGIALLHWIRGHHGADFPVILITGDPLPRVRAEAASGQATALLTKPLEFDELLLRLNAALLPGDSGGGKA